jgi:hypothetical protein
VFIKGKGNWTEYRKLGKYKEIDFHDGYDPEWRSLSYWDKLASFYNRTYEALKAAYENDVPYLIFTHGCSTSRPFHSTARSEVRGLMRSKYATPYIIRKNCIQHDTVFVAAIRPRKTTE